MKAGPLFFLNHPLEKNMQWNLVDACIENNSLLNSKFYQAWSHGELTLDDLRVYAKQYYALETTFPRLLSRIHSACDDARIRRAILNNLNDEEGSEEGAVSHPELWLQFAEGLGLTREEVQQAPLYPTTQQCIDTLFELAADPNPAVGLSALYAYESQLPAVSQSKIDGLKRFYGIQDERALQFFEVHKTADVWHSEEERAMIEVLNLPVHEVSAAAKKSCDALLTFLDGVDQVTRQTRQSAMDCCH